MFDIEHVTNVFYVDHWITVTQDGGADWRELSRGSPTRFGPRRRRRNNRRTSPPRRSPRWTTWRPRTGSG